MAFTIKLTDTLKDACDIAHADDASLFAFILKNEGHDAQSFAANTSEEMLFCVLATIITGLEEVSGLDRKKIFKILDKTMAEAGPIIRREIDEDE